MDWISQNWIWIAMAIGGYFLMSRMGGCGMGHSHGHSHPSSGHQRGSDSSSNNRQAGPGQMVDPVSQHMLSADAAISSVHKGRAYFFEDRVNRDAFESNPEKYLAASHVVGQQIASPAAAEKGNNAENAQGLSAQMAQDIAGSERGDHSTKAISPLAAGFLVKLKGKSP